MSAAPGPIDAATSGAHAEAGITAVVLAGGQGRRMGGVDKGLASLDGRPMVAWVLERIAPQVSEVLINANRNLEQYAQFGFRVVSDEVEGFAGPLAGLQRGLAEARHARVVTVPCDSPFLPLDLVRRLAAALDERAADLAVARTGDRAHPVFCLCRRSLLPHLNAYLETGGRKIDAWYSTLRVAEVGFDDQAGAFDNINTRDELDAARRGSG
jgi:molybdenum cofactor guanylyltransferase